MRRTSRSLWSSFGATLVALVLPITPAVAGGPTMTVKNREQPGLVSAVPQAPVSVVSRGSCGDIRTIEEANGEESPCPPGTWPEQGDQAWFASTVDAIGGDTLELRFSQPPDFVAVTLTTGFPIGLKTPPCPTSPTGLIPCVDGDVLVPNLGATLIAFPTESDPAVFTVTLPVVLPGSQVAVTGAGPAAAASNFAFSLASPRWDDAIAKCGTAFFAPGDTRKLCPRDDIKGQPPGDPPPSPLPPDPTTPVTTIPPPAAPALRLVPAPKLRGNKLTIATNATAGGKLTVALRRGGVTLVRKVSEVPSGATQRAITLRRSQWRKLARHPKRVYWVVAKLDADGKTVTTSAKVKWRAAR